jgi:ABC-type sugar transport system permease subunit
MRDIKVTEFDGKLNIFSRLKKAIGDRIYNLQVKIHSKIGHRQKSVTKARKRELLFYIAFMAIPVIQFCIFYIGVNFNSILLAFQRYDVNTGKYFFYGLQNFDQFFFDLALPGSPLNVSIFNSLIVYAGTLGATMLSLLFSFYIYKKKTGSQAFRIILFLPSIISTIVLVILYKYFLERAVPEAAKSIFGLTVRGPLGNSETRFATIVIYNIWVGFGTGVLIYTGAMTRIPPDVTEYASLDGISNIKEFFYITLPLIYPTLSAFLTVGVAGIFINQAHLYDFFGDNLPDSSLYTIGYFLFRKVIGRGTSFSNYPYASAAGIVFTLIAAPITIFVKWALEKLGPSTEY